MKDIVGDRIKENRSYKEMLDSEGRRCWTINYRNESKTEHYHIDILPSITDHKYIELLNRAFSDLSFSDYNALALRITDRLRKNYSTDIRIENWLKSNPFGYARWFYSKAILINDSYFKLSDRIKPNPEYQKEKLPLQRVIQLLKRHRDIMFDGDKGKPISIIITTLAAKAYNKELDIVEAFTNIVLNMDKFIESRFDYKLNKYIKYISNPVNEDENFADKWIEFPERESNFFNWLYKIRKDVDDLFNNDINGIHNIAYLMKSMFGEQTVGKALVSYGEKKENMKDQGVLKVASKTGVLGNVGTSIKKHNFFGD